jgi:hypothetical protein
VRRADADALVDGDPVSDARGLDDVQDFFARMRNDFAEQPAPEPRPVLASILDGRRPLRTAEPIAPTTTTRPASILGRNRWPRPVAAVLATGTLMFSGLAVAGALPAPVQRVSADVGASLGFDLPRPADSTPTPGSGSTPSATASPDHTDTPDGGAGRTGPAETDQPAGDPKTSAPSGTSPITGPSGVVPTVPTTPSLSQPLPLPLPTGLLPSVTTLPLPLGLDPSELLPDVPRVPRGARNP